MHKGGQGQHRVVHQSKAWHTLQCIKIQFSLWLNSAEILCTLHFNLLTRCTLTVQIADLSALVMHQFTESKQHIQLTLCSLEWCCIVSYCRIQLQNSSKNSYYRTLLQNSTRETYHWILYVEFHYRILLQDSTTESYCRICNVQIAQIDGEQAVTLWIALECNAMKCNTINVTQWNRMKCNSQIAQIDGEQAASGATVTFPLPCNAPSHLRCIYT